MSDTIEITRTTAPNNEVRTLVGELEAALSANYEPHQRHGLALEAIFQPHIAFYVARLNGTAVGCGGIAKFDGFAELKRMYVRDGVRGRGVAPAILARLEQEAAGSGYDTVRLETGTRQHAAQRFYAKCGYAPCVAFGDYTRMRPEQIAESVFMEKRLARASVSIVTIVDRPDLVPTVAGWLWQAFWRNEGYKLEDTAAAVAAALSRSGPPQCFVALAHGEPVGTASLVAHDLDERPELTPWLAGVFVAPQARRQGHATRLVAAVEAACHDAAIPIAWLYTNSAEALYTRAGWRRVEIVAREARPPVTLMQKAFERPSCPPPGEPPACAHAAEGRR